MLAVEKVADNLVLVVEKGVEDNLTLTVVDNPTPKKKKKKEEEVDNPTLTGPHHSSAGDYFLLRRVFQRAPST